MSTEKQPVVSNNPFDTHFDMEEEEKEWKGAFGDIESGVTDTNGTNWAEWTSQEREDCDVSGDEEERPNMFQQIRELRQGKTQEV